ncbi:MAG: helix-turn-helix transcriptional regulator [Bacteroidia bacterium]|nr:helix-turn-helix transcriptional regulator [Bacteroidia bacterium]
MINKFIINRTSMSNSAIVRSLGSFIREHRIRQNKTQAELAGEAGISRMSLNFFENGENTSLITFISLLRALNLLYTLDAFVTEQQISPLQLARMLIAKRSRATGTSKKTGKVKSDW